MLLIILFVDKVRANKRLKLKVKKKKLKRFQLKLKKLWKILIFVMTFQCIFVKNLDICPKMQSRTEVSIFCAIFSILFLFICKWPYNLNQILILHRLDPKMKNLEIIVSKFQVIPQVL
jgi:hypothetical protein